MQKVFRKMGGAWRKGFTLAELLIVVAIIAVLSVASILVLSTGLEKSREATDVANLRNAKAAATAKYLDDDRSAGVYYYDAEKGSLVSWMDFEENSITPYGQGTTKWGGIESFALGNDKEYDQTSDAKDKIIRVTFNRDGSFALAWTMPNGAANDASSFTQFRALSDDPFDIAINSDGSISMSHEGTPIGEIPAVCVSINGNEITVAGTGTEYDAVYTICDDGYLEQNGVPIAKAESEWIGAEDDYDAESLAYRIVVHNGVAYTTYEGNILSGYAYGEFADGYDALVEYMGRDEEYQQPLYGTYEVIETGEFTVRQFFNVVAFQNCSRGSSTWINNAYLYGNYPYYGAYATDAIVGNSLVTNARWHSYFPTNTQCVEGVITKTAYKLVDGIYVELPLDYLIDDGLYAIAETEEYYHLGVKTEHIFFCEDEPYYFEPGMTFRDWSTSTYAYSIVDSRPWSYNESGPDAAVYPFEWVLDESIIDLFVYSWGDVRCVMPIAIQPSSLEYSFGDVDYWYNSDWVYPGDTITFRGANAVRLYYYTGSNQKTYINAPAGLTFSARSIYNTVYSSSFGYSYQADSDGCIKVYVEIVD